MILKACNVYFLNQLLTLFTPSTPSIVKPPYCALLARPKKSAQSAPRKTSLTGNNNIKKEIA